MSYLGLIILIVLMVGLIAFMAIDTLRQYWTQIKHIRECRKHYHAKDAYVIDYWRLEQPFALDGHRQWMDSTKKWVPRGDYIEEPYEDLYRAGYMKAEKWMPQLRYIGIPVFVKLHNFKIADPRTMDPSVTGHKRNRVTTSILYNVYKARTLKRAIAGFGKVKLAEMDTKAMMFIILAIVGIGIAIYYFYAKGGF